MKESFMSMLFSLTCFYKCPLADLGPWIFARFADLDLCLYFCSLCGQTVSLHDLILVRSFVGKSHRMKQSILFIFPGVIPLVVHGYQAQDVLLAGKSFLDSAVCHGAPVKFLKQLSYQLLLYPGWTLFFLVKYSLEPV